MEHKHTGFDVRMLGRAMFILIINVYCATPKNEQTHYSQAIKYGDNGSIPIIREVEVARACKQPLCFKRICKTADRRTTYSAVHINLFEKYSSYLRRSIPLPAKWSNNNKLNISCCCSTHLVLCSKPKIASQNWLQPPCVA